MLIAGWSETIAYDSNTTLADQNEQSQIKSKIGNNCTSKSDHCETAGMHAYLNINAAAQ